MLPKDISAFYLLNNVFLRIQFNQNAVCYTEEEVLLHS